MPTLQDHNSHMANLSITDAIHYARRNALPIKVTLFDMATIIDQSGERTCSDDSLKGLLDRVRDAFLLQQFGDREH